MTTAPSSTSAPPLLLTLIHDYAQKALTAGAVALAAHGVIQSSQETQAVQLGVSAILFVTSCVWTYATAKFRTARLNAAIAAPAVAPKAP